MKNMTILSLLFMATLLSTCNVFLPEQGHEGQPCTDSGVCIDGSDCIAGTCRDTFSCQGGICKDLYTFLEWQETPMKEKMDPLEANHYCKGLSLNGEGWRLPSISELRSLSRGCSYTQNGCHVEDNECLEASCADDGSCLGCSDWKGKAGSGCYWPNKMKGNCGLYFSSSSVADDWGNVWSVHFSYGGVHHDKTIAYARCVRGHQEENGDGDDDQDRDTNLCSGTCGDDYMKDFYCLDDETLCFCFGAGEKLTSMSCDDICLPSQISKGCKTITDYTPNLSYCICEDNTTDGDDSVDGDDVDVSADGDDASRIYTDPTTNLEWQKIPGKTFANWSVAKNYCNGLKLNGTGWRLPNISELRSLVRNCGPIETKGACGVKDACLSCGIGYEDECAVKSCWTKASCNPSSCVDNGGPTYCYWPMLADFSGTCTWYWSSTPCKNCTESAWAISFNYGDLEQILETNYLSVRCVR